MINCNYAIGTGQCLEQTHKSQIYNEGVDSLLGSIVIDTELLNCVRKRRLRGQSKPSKFFVKFGKGLYAYDREIDTGACSFPWLNLVIYSLFPVRR